jgi:hypothetical protein
MTNEQQDMLRTKLNMETAQISWIELQKFFAGGYVIAVSPDLDLVEVALAVSLDRVQSVQAWMADGKFAKVSDELASHWLHADALLWSVVVKPWVLVQDKATRAN